MKKSNREQQLIAIETASRLNAAPFNIAEFVQIPGCEGRCSISRDGRVFSHEKNALLPLRPTNTGYLYVCLKRDGDRSLKWLVQYLVVATFIEDFPNGAWIDHENRIRSDNRVENLRASSRTGNCRNKVGTKVKFNTPYRGVIFKTQRALTRPWVASINSNNKKHWGHYFATDREAAEEYDRMATLLHGEFALTNKSLGLL